MNSETLIEKLDTLKAYRKTRLAVAHWVIARPETFSELLNYCFKTNDKTSYKAAWVLEYVCDEKLELLLPYLELFLKNIPKANKDQAIRPFSKICLMLTEAYLSQKNVLVLDALNFKRRETITECCFDWLITDQKVATEAYAMHTLFLLGTKIEWIHPELTVIIEQNINTKSAAYKARGRMTLNKIIKHKNKS